jgi:hypothetical protein
MLRTKTVLATATAALIAAAIGSLGAAQADTTGSSGTTAASGTTGTANPVTITVNGAGFVTLDENAPTATFQSGYLSALGNAQSDAKAKATMLATQSGDTLGAVQNITEQSNDDGGCASPIFAAAGSAKGAPAVAPTPKKHRKHHAAVRAAAIARVADDTNTTCTIEADVTVTYAMAPS